MERTITVGAAQLGPNMRDTKPEEVVPRMVALLDEAKSRGCDLVVYPEFALLPWFATWWIEVSTKPSWRMLSARSTSTSINGNRPHPD